MERQSPSPFEGADLRIPAHLLPRSPPPRWMHWLIIASVIAAAVLTTFTLLGPLDEVVQVGGEVRPAEYRLIYAWTEKAVTELPISVGERVSAGTTLARLDSWEPERERRLLIAELARAEAEVASAVAALRRTRAAPVLSEFLFNGMAIDHERRLVQLQRDVLGRLEDLHRQGGASDLQILNQRQQVVAGELALARHEQAAAALGAGLAEATLAEAEAAAHAAEARAATLRERIAVLGIELERHRIVTPVDGQLIAAAVRFPGERARLGEPLFKIAIGDLRRLRLAASEDRLGDIRPGQTVRFRARSDPDRLSPMGSGRVLEVALDRDLERENDAPAAGGGGRSYRILVELAEGSRPIPFGAQVDAEIVIRQRPFWRLLLLKTDARKP